MYYLYILECDRAFFYVGITKDLDIRIAQHKSKHSPHTKRYSVVKLVYSEVLATINGAERREKQVKGWSRAKKKALIDGDIDLLKRLSLSKDGSDGTKR